MTDNLNNIMIFISHAIYCEKILNAVFYLTEAVKSDG